MIRVRGSLAACRSLLPARPGALHLYRLAAVLLLAGGICLPVRAQLARLGGEFRVNAAATGNQRQPDVAALADGGFVVVWSEEDDQHFQRRVLGQRFAPTGMPLGREFQVAPFSRAGRQGPRTAGMPDGGFVVVWDEIIERRILARRYGPDGAPVGGPFQVDAIVDPDEAPDRSPDVATAADGSFVVTWQSQAYSLVKRYDDFTKARRFSVAGQAQGPEFVVATDISDYDQYDPAIDVGSDGSFVVVWNTDRFSAAWGRSFDAAGTALGPAFLAGSMGSSSDRPDVCVQDHGGFVVAWSSYFFPPGGEDEMPVQYRLYNREGQPTSPPRRVMPALKQPSERDPALACGRNGQFVLAWNGTSFIEGAWFAGPEAKLRYNFRIGRASLWRAPSVATLSADRFVVTWDVCEDADRCDVFAQVFTLSGVVDCAGDCNRDARVTIDEVVRAVRIDLDSYNFPTWHCLPADPGLDYEVSVGELLQAVGHALDGCP